jgi:tetratricopeptide (TPR) repeat protein
VDVAMDGQSGAKQTYKVKLESGRVLGPLDLERVRLLILKNQILGKELARSYPQGEWVKIGAIPEIAHLLVARAEGKLSKKDVFQEQDPNAATHILPGGFAQGATQVVLIPESTSSRSGAAPKESAPPSRRPPENSPTAEEGETDVHERTEVNVSLDRGPLQNFPDIKDLVLAPGDSSYYPISPSVQQGPDEQRAQYQDPGLARAETVMLDLSKKRKKKVPLEGKEKIKAILAAVALGIAGYMVFLDDGPPKPTNIKVEAVRPSLPKFSDKPDPSLSQKYYLAAMKDYVQDTVLGYRDAAAKLQNSSAADINNVKALAMLASTYLNLIDSSNKDENYFSVISKLTDMTRAKSVDLTETVIADVEFFVTVNKPEAAQNRIVEYARTHQNFSIEMFYYLSLAFYARGDYQSASRYIQQIPDNKAFSPKVFYLRGLIAERLEDEETALREYGKALQLNKLHAKSRLRIASIMNQRGVIKDAEVHLNFLTHNPRLLSPKDLALAFYLHSLLTEQKKDVEVALGDAERAVQLDKDDHAYLLQLYSMRAKGGESMVKLRTEAKMYYYLEEGENALRHGKPQDALTQFLQARQANDKSPIPLVKIGDMFRYLHDLGNAQENYRMAADRAPNNIDIWTKFIDVLIQSYEWDEAQKAMEKFRKLPVSQSAIDKAAGDMYAKQGDQAQAQLFYKKAMARESIDPTVYTAFAKSLMATQNFKEAPFFFALAQRYDPLNVDAIIGTAQCVANTDSIERAIGMLQDELQKSSSNRAEFLGAIADFQIQRGNWDIAQKTIDDAMSANPDYAYPWKLQAEVYMNNEGKDKKAFDKALQAYQSYSDRNSSDPSGYLERYRIFIRKAQFDKAADELGKIFGIYPKYPNLHFYKGALYGMEGNHKLAVDEYKLEIANNANNVQTLIALGKEYIELGALPEALALFNKAMLLAPNAGEPKHMSGYANYLLKNYSGAIALYNAAIARDPGNPLIYKRLGLVYRDVGDLQKAADSFQRYLQMEPDAPDRAEFARYAH